MAYAGDPGTKVCVIDSGIDLGHPDLPGAERVTGNSSVPGPWFEDVSGHGSHVTGTITAVRNEIGVRGVVAQGNAQIHVYRVFDVLAFIDLTFFILFFDPKIAMI